jgi:hypothetical protein
MDGILEGVRVLEAATWTFVPAPLGQHREVPEACVTP